MPSPASSARSAIAAVILAARFSRSTSAASVWSTSCPATMHPIRRPERRSGAAPPARPRRAATSIAASGTPAPRASRSLFATSGCGASALCASSTKSASSCTRSNWSPILGTRTAPPRARSRREARADLPAEKPRTTAAASPRESRDGARRAAPGSAHSRARRPTGEGQRGSIPHPRRPRRCRGSAGPVADEARRVGQKKRAPRITGWRRPLGAIRIATSSSALLGGPLGPEDDHAKKVPAAAVPPIEVHEERRVKHTARPRACANVGRTRPSAKQRIWPRGWSSSLIPARS